MNRIKFTLASVGLLELMEVEGIVWIEDGFLVLEIKQSLAGLVDTDNEVVKIEPSALNDIFIQRRWFKDRLVLVPKKRELLDVIPGKHVNDVRLRIWRTKRSEVENLIEEFHEVQWDLLAK